VLIDGPWLIATFTAARGHLVIAMMAMLPPLISALSRLIATQTFNGEMMSRSLITRKDIVERSGRACVSMIATMVWSTMLCFA